MNEAQEHAFYLRLSELNRLAEVEQDLSGCLLAACSSHDPDSAQQTRVIKFLVQAGVPVNETDKNGVTPLHRAVRFRSLAAVDCLLALGADANAADRRSGNQPLHRAVTNSGAPSTAGKKDIAAAIVRSLCAHGANPKARNKAGKSPDACRGWSTVKPSS